MSSLTAGVSWSHDLYDCRMVYTSSCHPVVCRPLVCPWGPKGWWVYSVLPLQVPIYPLVWVPQTPQLTTFALNNSIFIMCDIPGWKALLLKFFHNNRKNVAPLLGWQNVSQPYHLPNFPKGICHTLLSSHPRWGMMIVERIKCFNTKFHVYSKGLITVLKHLW